MRDSASRLDAHVQNTVKGSWKPTITFGLSWLDFIPVLQ